jgi:hypothetical protein
MLRRALRYGVPVMAAGVVAVTSATAQASGPPGWRIVQALPASSQVLSITALGASDAWAAGMSCGGGTCNSSRLLVRHWDGNAWRTVAPPTGFVNSASLTVAASSASSAWVFGTQGTSTPSSFALHWTGRAWAAPFRFPAKTEITTAVTPARGGVWAFGHLNRSAYAAHYNGRTWSKVPVPVIAAGASAVSARNIWAVGYPVSPPSSGSAVAVMHWNGTSWKRAMLPRISVPKNAVLVPANIIAIGASNVWADALPINLAQGPVGGTVMLHWNGKAWAWVKIPRNVAVPFALTQDGHGGIWLSGYPSTRSAQGYLYHDSNGHWSQLPVPHKTGMVSAALALAWIPGTGSVWGAGVEIPPASGPVSIILKYGP